MVPVALFDLDNTLVDRGAAFRGWASAFCEEHGLGFTGLQVLREQDDDGFATREEVFRAIRDRFAVTLSVAELIERYRMDYPRFYQPDPRVLEALRGLRNSGWRIGIVTNGPGSQIEKIERCGLHEVADAWTISEELGVEKPDPFPFLETIRRCGGDGNSTVWMVGDAITDIEGGRKAACRTVWLHRGRSWAVREYRPDAIADSVLDAVHIILVSADSFPAPVDTPSP